MIERTERGIVSGERCPGVGSPALNVGRGFIGNRLAMVGECRICGRRPEITREWTVKYHRVPSTSEGEGA